MPQKISSIEHGGTKTFSNIMAKRWPSSMRGHKDTFFHLMEVPTMRLPNVKMLLRWPSRMHIYCFVEITLYLCTMHWLLISSLLWGMESRHRVKPDICFSKHQSALLGGDWGFQCHKVPIGPGRNKRKLILFTQ